MNVYLFPELKPGERIYKIVESKIYPALERIGFKISKSSPTLKRIIGDFEQEIHFSKSKWNAGSETVRIDPHFSVRFRPYVKWHNDMYGSKPLNDFVVSTRAYYIPNWSKELYNQMWYDFSQHDNTEIVTIINDNIHKHGLPFLNSNSDKQLAIDFILNEKSYWRAPMLYDFAYCLNDKEQAKKILTWFQDYQSGTDKQFPNEVLSSIAIRQEALRNWA